MLTLAPTATELDGFRAAQQLAYACAESIAATLEPGVTERQAATAMRHWLEGHGVGTWFHLPFAWFGDRTAFRGVRLPHQFFPTDRRLQDGMAYILDCAPIVDGYVADIGYTASLGPNAVVDLLLDDLAEHRALIVAEVAAGAHLRDVYLEVERLATGFTFTEGPVWNSAGDYLLFSDMPGDVRRRRRPFFPHPPGGYFPNRPRS